MGAEMLEQISHTIWLIAVTFLHSQYAKSHEFLSIMFNEW